MFIRQLIMIEKIKMFISALIIRVRCCNLEFANFQRKLFNFDGRKMTPKIIVR